MKVTVRNITALVECIEDIPESAIELWIDAQDDRGSYEAEEIREAREEIADFLFTLETVMKGI
jgi:hypothetical protein